MNKDVKKYKRASMIYPYLAFPEKFNEYIETVQKSSRPDVFTFQHFKVLGFGKRNDRDFVYLIKHMQIINNKGVPTDMYDDVFVNRNKREEALLIGMNNAYKLLFQINSEAYKLKREDLLVKFKSIYPELDSKENNYEISNSLILSKMVDTFMTISSYIQSYINSGITEVEEEINKYDKYFAIKKTKNEKAVYINIPDSISEKELINIFNMIKKFLN